MKLANQRQEINLYVQSASAARSSLTLARFRIIRGRELFLTRAIYARDKFLSSIYMRPREFAMSNIVRLTI